MGFRVHVRRPFVQVPLPSCTQLAMRAPSSDLETRLRPCTRSERWLGGGLQLTGRAEFAQPSVACNPLDNPLEPNAGGAPPAEGYAWLSGPYSEPDAQGERVRTVKCTGADGQWVNDTFCIDPTIPEDELWMPATKTTSKPIKGKIAIIDRGVCTFINKGRGPRSLHTLACLYTIIFQLSQP